ncbi:MAG: sensor histidine kinase [Candidatus Methylacidiphilales bacterium]
MILKKFTYLSVLLVFVFACKFVKAQYPAYISLVSENIFTSKHIYDLFLDSKGYVWIGHEKGLTRYSGYNIKNFTHPLMNSFELSNIIEDENGTIWCANFVGQVFYIKNDSITLLNKKSNYTFFSKSGLVQGNKKIYYIENNIINEVDIDSFSIKKIYPNCLNLINYYSYLKNKGLVLNTNLGVYIYSNNKFKKLTHNKEFDTKKLNIKCIDKSIFGIDHSGRKVYILINSRWRLFIDATATNSDITTFNKIGKKFYCNTYNGIIITDLVSNKQEHFFKDYSISDQIIDRQGNLWVSALYSGVFIIPDPNNVKQFLPRIDNITTICLINDKNLIAVGTKNGKVFLLNKNALSIVKEINLHEIKNIENIYYDASSNQLNVSTLNHFTIDLKNYTLKKVPKIINAKSIVAHNHQYYYVNSFSLFLANTSLSNKINANNKWLGVANSKLRKNAIELISNERFYKIVFSEKQQMIVAASINNLYYLKNFRIGKFKYNNSSISAKQLIQHNGLIFAAQTNKGLYVISDTNKVMLFDALPLKSITNFCISGNKLIINCNQGLYSLDLTTRKLQSLLNSINFPNNSFELLSGDDNYIYATELNSIVKFNNKVKTKTAYKTPINITKILVNNIEYKSLNKLQHTENNISIYFDVINYKLPRNLIIKYRLNTDDVWKEIPALQGYITLSLLPPGKYDLQIEVANEKGTNPIKIEFEIKQQLYKTWWFIVLIVLVSSGLVMFVMYIRIQNIRFTNKLRLEKVELEKDLRQSLLTSIRTQMNPHFIFNALNTIHSFIYTNDKKNASEYLIKFSDLTRLILEMSEKESVSLKEELQALELYLSLENVRLNEMLDYNFIIDSAIVKDYIRIPPMIIQPYVENAIKHGLLHKKGDKKISIYFTLNNQVLIITIEDNGVGRYKSTQINKSQNRVHKSFSTRANKKRIEILNQDKDKLKTGIEIIDLYDEKNNPLGTRVIIEIPVIIL